MRASRLVLMLLFLASLVASVLADPDEKRVLRPWRPEDPRQSELHAGFAPRGVNYGKIGILNVANPSQREQVFRLKEGMSVRPDPPGPNAEPSPPPRAKQGLRVRLLDNAGRPLPGIAVVLVPPAGFTQRLEAVTDSQGYAQFLDPPAGKYRSYRIWAVTDPGRGAALEYAPREVQVEEDRMLDLGTWTPTPIQMPKAGE